MSARDRLQVLAEASSAFADALIDPDALAVTIARIMTETLGDGCAIFLADESGAVLRLAAFFHRNPEVQSAFTHLFSQHPIRVGEGVTGRVAETQVAMLVPKLDFAQLMQANAPELKAGAERFPAHTLLAVPLKARRRVLGVLTMSRHETLLPYTGEDVVLAEDVAGRAAMALEVSTLLSRERLAAQRLGALAEASKAIQTLDLDTALAQISRVGATLIGDACIITLLEDDQLTAKLAAHHDAEAERSLQAVVGVAIPEHSLPTRVVRENRAVRIEDATQHSTAVDAAKAYRQAYGVASIVICPLRVEGRAIGTLGVSRNGGGAPYTAGDEQFLQELADRAALAIQNARLYQAAQRASMLKDDFLAAASHELRTPITTIQLMLQSVLRQLSRTETVPREWLLPRLERATAQAKRLISHMDSLLDVSRIHSGRLVLQPEELDLAELVRSVADRFIEVASTQGVQLNVEAPAPVVGQWDRDRLDQVVTNLLSNALKYGAERPVTVTAAANGNGAELRVKDVGVGIAPEHHARIFERFERAEAGKDVGGFGIGLWIVREIVTAMNGTVRVESTLGNGATFIVELPRA